MARIEIGARPSARLPEPGLASSRLSRYTEAVKRTVATRFLKEKLGCASWQSTQAATSSRFGWVLWTREDSHWFAPFRSVASRWGPCMARAAAALRLE